MKIASKLSLRHLRRFANNALPSTVLVAALAVCASLIASPPSHTASSSAKVKATHHWFQIGRATWYGRAFQGKRTANGEVFNMNALTCAHRTLPLGSWLRVTNLSNRQSTFVRVTDRGPYTPGAIVDLSYAAAKRVGLFGKGQVRVEQVSPSDPELTHALLAQLSPVETQLGLLQGQ